MTITKELLKTLRVDMDAALAAVAEKHGVSLKVGNCTFSADTFTFKVEGIAEGGVTKEAAYYEMMAKFDKELPPLNAVVKVCGQLFNVVGMRSRGKNTMVIKRVTDGKIFVASAMSVKNGVLKEAA